MSKRSQSGAEKKEDRARVRLIEAAHKLQAHPLFATFGPLNRIRREPLGKATWALVDATGIIRCDTRLAEIDEWVWVIAHQLCHLGMGHFNADRVIQRDGQINRHWNAACCVEVDRFLMHLKIGRAPLFMAELPDGNAESLWRRWRDNESVESDPGLYGVSDSGDMACHQGPAAWRGYDWEDCFSRGLRAAVSAAIEVAGGERNGLSGQAESRSEWRLALQWFVASYPLLGGVAAGLQLVEDLERCQAIGIRIAAVDAGFGEIIVNPHASLRRPEYRFVIAHEILHAALRHDSRAEGRNPWLWNIATDLVINGWLVELGVGEIPHGALLDDSLKGWSAEEVYELISKNLRKYSKVATFAGVGICDILPAGSGRGTVDLDEFYRRALANGLDFHMASGRGLLPAGLIEEIRARTHPPIGWEVELARWFDAQFPAAERHRTYARLSRRHSATPEIPRPALIRPEEWERTRTFGTVIDTSGSMDTQLLGKALGAVASYSAAREVSRARVVFCDAAAHDAGWLSPDEIAGRVKVRGRGGTVLQPGINLLQRADDFPDTGPILIITDADCDKLTLKREHAFLIPHGSRLPFVPRGPVFRMR